MNLYVSGASPISIREEPTHKYLPQFLPKLHELPPEKDKGQNYLSLVIKCQ